MNDFFYYKNKTRIYFLIMWRLAAGNVRLERLLGKCFVEIINFVQ